MGSPLGRSVSPFAASGPGPRFAAFISRGQDVSTLGVVGALFGGIISASAALGKNLLSAVS
jgi:hypothetical protein